jgi:hypothetical protein
MKIRIEFDVPDEKLADKNLRDRKFSELRAELKQALVDGLGLMIEDGYPMGEGREYLYEMVKAR